MAILDLPVQATSFIGRTRELEEIAALLHDPACRLLTLVGPGGMGKTRLAIEAARHMAAMDSPSFANGIYFVDLQPVASGDLLVTAIAHAIGLHLSGLQEPREQLLNALRDAETLLLLDNFEQLLDAVVLLADIFKYAPQVRLVVTSREALNIQEEWLWRVAGLPVPDQQPGTRFESYSAVELFAERARRAQQDFTLVGQEIPITQICQLVDGMPLALELAAAWTKALSCTEIAQEIQRGLDFLTTNRRNIPERHRSMQAVFDHSWRLLTETERAVFPRLSIFRGGFRREAAEQVAGASLAVLAGLVDKSFLRLNTAGRYEIHELMRQYGEEHLEDMQEIQNRHCLYFADFLYQHKLPLRGPKQAHALDEIRAELDNIRLSWEWAVEHGMLDQIHQSMHALHLFCHIRPKALEGERLFNLAIKRFEQEDSATLGYLLLAQIELAWLNGRIRQDHQFLRGLSLAQKFWTGDEIALHLRTYYLVRESLMAQDLFDDLQMEQIFHDFQAIFKTHHQPWGAAWMLYCVGDLMETNGRFDEAEPYLRQSMNDLFQLGDLWASAWPNSALASLLGKTKRYHESMQLWQEHYDICAKVGDSSGVVFALGAKAFTERLAQNYQAAKFYIAQSLKAHLQQGSQVGQVNMVFQVLIEVYVNENRFDRAAEISSFLREYAGTIGAKNVVDVASKMLDSFVEKLTPDVYLQAVERGKKLHFTSIVQQLEAEVADYSPASSQTTSVDTLTERELDVLRLLAAGYSNREIAESLILAIGTVKWYISEIYSKLGVASRTQAIARAGELNILT